MKRIRLTRAKGTIYPLIGLEYEPTAVIFGSRGFKMGRLPVSEEVLIPVRF